MEIKFIIENLAASPIPARNYDSNFDDIRSIISDVCKGLAGYSDFIVSGFGQERWPVDVETDLAIFLEQLSDALQAIRGSQGFELFFMNKGSNASSFLRRWSHSVTVTVYFSYMRRSDGISAPTRGSASCGTMAAPRMPAKRGLKP